MKRLLLVTALAMLATPYASGAKIKIDKKCIEGMREAGIDRAQAKHWCDPRTKKVDCDKVKCE